MTDKMKANHDSVVISLLDKGELGAKIEANGVPVHVLGMKPGSFSPGQFHRLVALIREIKPDVVHTWMYHADLLGGVASRLAGVHAVVWSLHHTNLAPSVTKRTTILTARLCACLSKIVPRKIVSCSEVAKDAHIRFGYSPTNMTTIPNGYDVSEYVPNRAARDSVRAELGLPVETPLIGIVGRFHPQKDHRTFVRAAGRLHLTHPHVHFLLVGKGIDWDNLELVSWIDEERIREVVHLVGQRDDIPRLDAALDIATISSIGEGFPNVVGEAMACGIPCVVTNVGDTGYLVGETGIVVPPSNPGELAAGWAQILIFAPEEKREIGEEARARILKNFTIEAVVLQYEAVYRESMALGVRR